MKVIGIYAPPQLSAETDSCAIQVGDIQLTYPAVHLTEILRAARASLCPPRPPAISVSS